MLQLTGGVGLRVDVGDLLQLQRALQTHGVIHVAADEEDGLMVEVMGGQILDVLLVLQHLLHAAGQQPQLVDEPVVIIPVDEPQRVGKVQSQQVQHAQLRGVGLGGGNGDLRPRPGVQHVVALLGDGAAHHVDHAQRPCAQLLGLPQGGQRVRRLAGLADDDDQRLVVHDGVTVAELRRQRHLNRDAQHLLQEVLAHHADVV